MSHAARHHRLLDTEFLRAMGHDGNDEGDGALVASRNRLKDLRTMTNDRGRRPAGQQGRVLLARLVEYESAAGRPYLRGWLGGVNLIGFRGQPDEQGREVWDLFVVERQPRQEPPDRARDGDARGAARAG